LCRRFVAVKLKTLWRLLRVLSRCGQSLERLPEAWRAKIKIAANLEFRTPCWIWTGWNSGNGYGKVRVQGKAMMAHRAIYELLIRPIPPGYVLDHRCRNRGCCNPAHLECVSVKENTHRGQAILFRRTA
jgi:hypothetical protein